MIIGAHAVIYSTNPAADRAFLRDAIGLSAVDAGGGYLILGLPTAEVSVHESSTEELRHELFLMSDNIVEFIAQMQEHGVSCAAAEDTGWGLLTHVTLPGGGKLGVYQPRHARPSAS
jgi:hypothetical protein